MTATKTIVFGPTGGVGSAAAITAHERGAQVSLAMRDTGKAIPGLSAEQEKAGGFERVQADLLQPETVAAAVAKTGAKHAFIYLAYGSPDHMRSTVAALKSAGVEFVVLLSSLTIPAGVALRDIPVTELIPRAHAEVEIVLDDIFGPGNYVGVRPGYFASNGLRMAGMIRAGEVRSAYPDVTFDWINPRDIGAVAGVLLAGGPEALPVDASGAKQTFVPVAGPRLVSEREAVAIIGKTIGREIKVTVVDEKEALEDWIKLGMPPIVVSYLMGVLRKRALGEIADDHDRYAGATASVPKYAGRPAITLEEWAEENKKAWGA